MPHTRSSCICYAGPGKGMRPLHLVCITLLSLCHLHIAGQALTNVTPQASIDPNEVSSEWSDKGYLPEDPGQEILPVAQPEAAPQAGQPIRWDAQRQSHSGDTWTLEENVSVYYSGYVLHASKVVYHQSSSVLEAEGPLRLDGGDEDVHLTAANGDLRLNAHTARFYNVKGSLGVRNAGRTTVYSTTNPFRFSGRVLLQMGENNYRIVDGSMTNCRIPRPDWQLLARYIDLKDRVASTTNASFRFLNVPLFYLPYLRHPVDEGGRVSGLMIPVISNSTTKGLIVGEQIYLVLNRSMDMVLGAEYYSHRGWALNGDYRFKGRGDDHLLARWNGLLDRGVNETTDGVTTQVNQGGTDVSVQAIRNFSSKTHANAQVEYLSSYAYRLVFSEIFTQAVTSQVGSTVGVTHASNGLIPSLSLERFENFATSTTGSEARILHLPSLRYDVLDRSWNDVPVYFGMASSAMLLDRSEPYFHARNLGRFDLYPHLVLPLQGGGWTLTPEIALRDTFYTKSDNPGVISVNHAAATIRPQTLNRSDFEASVSLLPPALMRDFTSDRWNRVLRHVISSELTWHYVTGIGNDPQHIIRADTTDTANDTNEIGFRFSQRLYLKPLTSHPCPEGADAEEMKKCNPAPREWASWEISQKYYFDPQFGGALINDQRNVFDSTLSLSGVSFLNSPRNLSPITSRMRFEAINNLRVEWDLDYDPKAGNMTSDNVYAGYSFDRATLGVGHALLNAVNERRGGATSIKSQILQPFLTIGSPNSVGFNLAVNAGYDFALGQLQYNGVQTNYNWDCCGLSFGYRRFQLGTLRDETQYLYSFTIANFGSVGDIRRSNSVFHDPSQAPLY